MTSAGHLPNKLSNGTNKRGAGETEEKSRVISYRRFDLWPVFTLNMLCVQWQHPQFIAKYLPAHNKEVFHFPSSKESGPLQGRKRNYRTIIASKCKKGGEMWLVGREGVVNGHPAWYSCLWDLQRVPTPFHSSPTSSSSRPVQLPLRY